MTSSIIHLLFFPPSRVLFLCLAVFSGVIKRTCICWILEQLVCWIWFCGLFLAPKMAVSQTTTNLHIMAEYLLWIIRYFHSICYQPGNPQHAVEKWLQIYINTHWSDLRCMRSQMNVVTPLNLSRVLQSPLSLHQYRNFSLCLMERKDWCRHIMWPWQSVKM